MELLMPSQGRLLVSEPSVIGDESFSRSVILLTEFNEKGVVGFIMNKPTTYTLDQLVPEVNSSLPIYQGGPVDTDNLYFLHNVPHLIPDSHHIKDDIYWGGDLTTVSALLEDHRIDKSNIKFFLGYSGWAPE